MLSAGCLVILTCAVATHGAGPFRGECKREAIFQNGAKDWGLQNHLIASRDVTSPLDCALECINTAGCKSYNYQEAGSPLHKCELSDQTKSSKPSDYVIKPGFSYHDAEKFEVPVCSSSPCQNGATCSYIDCDDFLQCLCQPGYTGMYCETWIGRGGTSSSLYGKSCLTIKSLGQDNDGRYWIDPTNTGNPFTVSCDMTTDGGGWTVIKNVTLLSPSTDANQEFTDYRRISSLTTYQFVTQPGLLSLKTDMGFTQIRYFCRKGSVGRTFHIMTAKTALGFDVVRYLIVNPSPFPTACNSFVRLPDDDSILAANCDKWGYSASGTAMTNEWGRHFYTGSWRMYNKFVTWSGVRWVSFISGEYRCDDDDANGQTGDVWYMFVR